MSVLRQVDGLFRADESTTFREFGGELGPHRGRGAPPAASGSRGRQPRCDTPPNLSGRRKPSTTTTCSAATSLVGGGEDFLPVAAQPFDDSLFSGIHWRMVGPSAAGGPSPRPAFPASRSTSTSARSAGESGRARTPAAPGRRSSTASRSPRSGPWRSHRRTRRSSTSAPAKPTCARTSPTATACTSPPTAERPGRIGLADSRQIGRIVVDPKDADRVFVAALGHGYGPNPERGVFRSTRRRQDVEEGPRQGQRHRRHRPRLRPERLEDDPRRALADPAAPLERLSLLQRPRQRPLPHDRRRRHLERGQGRRLPLREARPHRRRLRATRLEARLRDRGREGGRPLRLEGRRRDVDSRVRGDADLGARLVLRRRDSRSERPRHGLCL